MMANLKLANGMLVQLLRPKSPRRHTRWQPPRVVRLVADQLFDTPERLSSAHPNMVFAVRICHGLPYFTQTVSLADYLAQLVPFVVPYFAASFEISAVVRV
jgi:hypothetical protein